jgi:hypothetical protein
MGYSTVVAGTTITASWANANVRDQVVTPFATTSARDSAISSPVDGMLAAITGTDALSYYDGAAWNQIGPFTAWTTYTPTLTNATLGNGTLTGAYMRIGRTIIWGATFTLGSTSAVSTAPAFALPATVGSSIPQHHFTAKLYDTSTATTYHGVGVCAAAGTNASLYTHNQVNVTSTVPFTWATGDQFAMSGTYEAAS